MKVGQKEGPVAVVDNSHPHNHPEMDLGNLEEQNKYCSKLCVQLPSHTHTHHICVNIVDDNCLMDGK